MNGLRRDVVIISPFAVSSLLPSYLFSSTRQYVPVLLPRFVFL